MIFTQEFNAVPIRDTLAAAQGATITWTSSILGVAAPVPNRPPGSDRAICRTVNGFLNVNVRNTAILSDRSITMIASLVGDQNGITGIIASQQVILGVPPSPAVASPTNAYNFLTGNRIGFGQFSTFANLAQSVYLKLIIYRSDPNILVPDDIDLTVTGAMLGADPVA
jgi:hypothetical protein